MINGIDVRTMAKLRDVSATGFQGNGIQIHSNRFPSALAASPNGNLSFYKRVSAMWNNGSGFLFFGGDANAFETHLINAENNGGFGVYENGTEGGTHYAAHVRDNLQGGFTMLVRLTASTL